MIRVNAAAPCEGLPDGRGTRDRERQRVHTGCAEKNEKEGLRCYPKGTSGREAIVTSRDTIIVDSEMRITDPRLSELLHCIYIDYLHLNQHVNIKLTRRPFYQDPHLHDRFRVTGWLPACDCWPFAWPNPR